MSSTHHKRVLYARIVKWMLLAGIIVLMLIFFTGGFPSRQNPAQLRVVDIADLAPGETREIHDMEYPVLIVHRTPEMIAQLKTLSDQELDDWMSQRSVQPMSAQNQLRSLREEYFVVVPMTRWRSKNDQWLGYMRAIHVPENDTSQYCTVKSVNWRGGFTDTHDQVICFDYAGRVYRYAQFDWIKQVNNLIVPEYEFISDTQIRINLYQTKLQ